MIWSYVRLSSETWAPVSRNYFKKSTTCCLSIIVAIVMRYSSHISSFFKFCWEFLLYLSFSVPLSKHKIPHNWLVPTRGWVQLEKLKDWIFGFPCWCKCLEIFKGFWEISIKTKPRYSYKRYVEDAWKAFILGHWLFFDRFKPNYYLSLWVFSEIVKYLSVAFLNIIKANTL